jgi:hypothetical protein
MIDNDRMLTIGGERRDRMIKSLKLPQEEIKQAAELLRSVGS